mmetsp:Transcript_15683/g.33928  ORF Transcript_15683/g.33928 Transcript_15683/m.33928 type:complete len:299 (-) Transcript_15683:362-1258(-)
MSIMTRCGLTSASISAVSFSRSKSIVSSSSSAFSFEMIVSMGIPFAFLAMDIFLELAPIMTRGHTPRPSIRARRCFWRALTNVDPTTPVAPKRVMLAVVSDRVKAWWAARKARVVSSLSTTTAICRSEDPCAINRMLTLALDKEPINVEEIPEEYAMPSPTIATIDTPLYKEMDPTVDRASSNSKASWMALIAFCPSFSGTAMQMEDSLLACVIINTLMSLSAMAPMNFSATLEPPMVDAPSSVTSATESTNVMPLMGISPFLALQFLTEPSAILSASDGLLPCMTIPTKEGLKIFPM